LVLLEDHEIKVFFSSRSIGGYMGREGFLPTCHACDTALGLNTKDKQLIESIPPEVMPLIFSAELAAKELGIILELVDLNQMPVFQKLKLKVKGIHTPCLKIGEEFIFGNPTKDEILECFNK
jgi:hypothetical protein